MRTITITISEEPRNYRVQEGEGYTDDLTWDEMLGQVATLTHPRLDGSGYYPLLTEEAHRQREERFKSALRAISEG
jgi:hypothetical protein